MKARILVAFWCIQHSVIASASQVYYWHPSTILRIGACFDPRDLTDAKRSAIAYDATEDVDVPKGGSAAATFTSGVLTNTHDLLDTLKIDADMSAHYLMFSGGGHLHDYEKQHFSSDSLTWYLQAFCDYGRSVVKSPRLTPEAQQLAAKPDEFRNAFGTHFVFQQRKAAMITVVFSVNHLSTETISSLNASVSAAASTPFAGGGFSASYQKALQEALKTSAISFSVYTRGGEGLSALAGIAKNIDDLVEIRTQISKYISTMNSDNAPPVEYDVQRLSTLAGGPQLETVPSLYSKAVDAYYTKYIQCEDTVSSLNKLIQAPPEQTCWMLTNDRDQIKASRQTYLNLESELLLKSQAIKDGKDQPSLPEMELPDPHLPTPNVVLMPFIRGFYGYVVGGDFDHVSFYLGDQTQAVARLMTLDEFKTASAKVKANIRMPDISEYQRKGMNAQQTAQAKTSWQFATALAKTSQDRVDQEVATLEHAVSSRNIDGTQRRFFHFDFVPINPTQISNYSFRLFDCSQQPVVIEPLPR
jgi:hypothetical protein